MSNVMQKLYARQTRLWSATDLLGILKACISTAVPHSTLRKVASKNYVCGVTIPPPLPRHPESREAPQGRNQEELQAQCCVFYGSVPAFNPWASLFIKDDDEETIVPPQDGRLRLLSRVVKPSNPSYSSFHTSLRSSKILRPVLMYRQWENLPGARGDKPMLADPNLHIDCVLFSVLYSWCKTPANAAIST